MISVFVEVHVVETYSLQNHVLSVCSNWNFAFHLMSLNSLIRQSLMPEMYGKTDSIKSKNTKILDFIFNQTRLTYVQKGRILLELIRN